MESLVLTRTSELDELVYKSVDRAVAKAFQNIGAPSSESKAWLSNEEAMAYLSLSRPTLARYRRDGKLPYSKIGTNVFYRRSDVESLLESGMQEG